LKKKIYENKKKSDQNRDPCFWDSSIANMQNGSRHQDKANQLQSKKNKEEKKKILINFFIYCSATCC
jgi:hypothetical protein